MPALLDLPDIAMTQPTAEQLHQWDEQGYLVIEDAVTGDLLERIQAAHTYWFEQCKLEWLDRVESADTSATYFDIPEPFEKDLIFAEIVDHPSWYGLLKAFMVAPIFVAPQVRTVPNWPVSYTSWHPDTSHGKPLTVKVQLYVNDVDEGAFGFIPGSHKPRHYTMPYVHRLKSMPGHKALAGKAGTAVIFNALGFHAAMENMSGSPRRSIILIYTKRTDQEPSDRMEAAASLCDTPERRRLFNLIEPS